MHGMVAPTVYGSWKCSIFELGAISGMRFSLSAGVLDLTSVLETVTGQTQNDHGLLRTLVKNRYESSLHSICTIVLY